jgi:hypothetical protein
LSLATSTVEPAPARARRPTATTIVIALAALMGASLLLVHSSKFVALAVATILLGLMVVSTRERSVLVIGAISYVAGLHWIYVGWVVPLNSYRGLISVSLDPFTLGLIIVIAVVPSLLLPVRVHRPSEILLWFLYLVGYVPAVSIPIHLLGPDGGVVFPFSVVLATAFVTLLLMQRLPRATLRWPGLDQRVFDLVLVGLGLVTIGFIIAAFGVPTSLPGLNEVYDTRAAYDQASSGIPGSAYIIPWAGNVIFPLLMALGLARRRYWIVLVGTAGELLVYGTTGFKTILFAIVLVPIVYLLTRHAPRVFGVFSAWGGVAALAATVVATETTHSGDPLALFVTRLLALPGQLTAYYYDFFTTHPTFALSRSFLRVLGQGPYDMDPPKLIGRVYLHSDVINPNANLWADAVANYGVAGIIPFTIVLGLVLWVMDSAADNRDLTAIAPVMALAGLTLCDGALFTALLTNGIGLAILLIAFMPRAPDATSNVETPSAHAPSVSGRAEAA